jgi:hypothetical protein
MFHSDIYYHHHLFLYFSILFNYLFHSIHFFEADTVSATIDDDDAHKKKIILLCRQQKVEYNVLRKKKRVRI